jgi:hypothetical protein
METLPLGKRRRNRISRFDMRARRQRDRQLSIVERCRVDEQCAAKTASVVTSSVPAFVLCIVSAVVSAVLGVRGSGWAFVTTIGTIGGLAVGVARIDDHRADRAQLARMRDRSARAVRDRDELAAGHARRRRSLFVRLGAERFADDPRRA